MIEPPPGAGREVRSATISVKHAPPPPELFAHYWNALPKRDKQGQPKRTQAADRWNVTVYAIDKWLKEARDLGLIARPTTTTNKKEKKQ